MKTERLLIRPIEEDDWQAIRNIWLDFNSSEYKYFDNEKNTEPDNVRTRIKRWAEVTKAGNEHIFLAVCCGGKVIGFYSLNARPGGYEIGYGFLQSAQGKGYASESLAAVLDYAKSLGADKIYAGTALKNIPSVHLLQKLGFELVGTEVVSFHKDEKGQDICFEGGNFEIDLNKFT